MYRLAINKKPINKKILKTVIFLRYKTTKTKQQKPKQQESEQEDQDQTLEQQRQEKEEIPLFVTPEWLEQRRHLRRVKVIDASWDLVGPLMKDIRKDFVTTRIPGALFFDHDKVTDKDFKIIGTKEVIHTLQTMGIANRDHVIIYDTSKTYLGSARLWWTLLLHGHRRVSILEGGLNAWIRSGGKTDSGEITGPLFDPTMYRVLFVPKFQKIWIKSKNQLLHNLTKTKPADRFQVVDGRPVGRYLGRFPEPIPGLTSGHMPQSLSLPYFQLLDTQIGHFKPQPEIQNIFTQSGIDLSKRVVSTCYTPFTASILSLAFAYLGHKAPIYEGCWFEWGRPDSHTPIWKGKNDQFV